MPWVLEVVAARAKCLDCGGGGDLEGIRSLVSVVGE